MSTSVPRDPAIVKKMADLLRSGAAMLAERCPICGLPLFRLKSGEVVCPIHGRVYIVRDETEYVQVTVQGVLEQLEKVVAEKLASMVSKLSSASVTNEDLTVVVKWLEVLERVERILDGLRRSRESKPGK